MLAVKLICVGKMRERFWTDAFAEYSKRLGAYCDLTVVEIPEQKLPADPSAGEIASALGKEAAAIEKAIAPDEWITALCVEGKEKSSEELAAAILTRPNSGKPRLCFVVGGSFGLDQKIKSRADEALSMSRMTFPHHLARVMLAEQIYRAFKIIEGSRYHK